MKNHQHSSNYGELQIAIVDGHAPTLMVSTIANVAVSITDTLLD